MTSNNILITLLAIALVVAAAFAAGALYQWYRHALERHDAWRDGYDQASGTLFKLAAKVGRRRPGENTTDIMTAVQEKKPLQPTRAIKPAGLPQATVTAISAAPSYGARHSYELRHEKTRRLIPQPADEKAI